MNSEEKEIRRLMKDAELYVEADKLKEAGEKIHQAIDKAESTRNRELLKEIMDFVKEFTYNTKTQFVELNPIKTDGFILDIGGGGEGIIGRLNGRQVVAIDPNERELLGAQNEALKVIMDATELKFLPKSFDICTSFFSMLYIPKNKHLKVFKEVHRVLKDNGRFLLWDARIPEKHGDHKAFLVHLKVRLPNEETEPGYGVKWQTQNIEHFKELGRRTKLKTISEWSKGEIFHLEMSKKA